MPLAVITERFVSAVVCFIEGSIRKVFRPINPLNRLDRIALHLFTATPHCADRNCRVAHLKEGILRFLARVATFVVTLCTAPHFLPQYAWRNFNPLPCTHRRCILRRYVASPAPSRPLYQRLLPKLIYQPIQGVYRKVQARRPRRYDENAFPLLRLPIEIRNLIYLHASGARKYHIRYQDPSRAKPLRYYPVVTNSEPFANEDGPSQDLICHHDGVMSTEDGIAYQLDDDTGFIAHRGSRPPTNLLLVCRQVHREVIDQFLSTTTFEVQPLTPNDVSWRLDKGKEGTYEALAKSAYASMMKKVLVRIDVSRFMMGRKSQQMNIAAAQVCTFDEIDLAVCTEIVATRAGELCDTLRVSIPNVKAVEIHWIDEFPETIEERGLQLRERVLLPFIRLPGVRVRIRKLVMADKGRTPVNMMMSRVLRRGA